MLDFSHLNKEQQSAVVHLNGPCCVIAGAGSGKTSVLIYRIANLIEQNINPSNILAVTFTKKASIEMDERLAKLVDQRKVKELNIGTFHSICYKIMLTDSDFRNKKIIKSNYQKSLVQGIIKKLKEKVNDEKIKLMPEEFLSFISWQKNCLITPKDDLDMSRASMPKAMFLYKHIYEEYQQQLQRKNLIDFDDMLIGCYNLFTTNKKILEKYQEKFQYILIDEFQDTNIAQYEIIKLISKKNKNVFCVGDARQAIYSWRASRVEFILNFPQEWINGKIIELNANYRSSKIIVDLSTKLIQKSTVSYPGLCYSATDIKNINPKGLMFFNDEQEADQIANFIMKKKKDGYKFGDFAILYRLNSQGRVFEDVFLKNNIPYYVNGMPSFYSLPEIQDMINYLKVIDDIGNDKELLRILNIPNRGLEGLSSKIEKQANIYDLSIFKTLVNDKDKDKKYQDGVYDFISNITHLQKFAETAPNLAKVLEEIRKVTKYDEWIQLLQVSEEEGDNNKIDNLNSFQISLDKFEKIKDFLKHLEDIETQSKDKTSEAERVQFMTFHRSKGLEYSVVFMVGMANGIFPHRRSCKYDEEKKIIMSSIEEERRLCYVGITRAKKELFLSCARFYSKAVYEKSIFFNELTPFLFF